MDPNENLKEKLELAGQDWTGEETADLSLDELKQLHADHIRLCELVQSLHLWLYSGGCLPDVWWSKQG